MKKADIEQLHNELLKYKGAMVKVAEKSGHGMNAVSRTLNGHTKRPNLAVLKAASGVLLEIRADMAQIKKHVHAEND